MLYIDKLLNDFKVVYGQKRYNKIESDMLSSKHFNRLLNTSLRNSLYPPGDQIVLCVTSNLRYSFAKFDTLVVASLIILKEWADIYTSVQDCPIEVIRKIEIEIFNKISTMSSRSSLPTMLKENVFKINYF